MRDQKMYQTGGGLSPRQHIAQILVCFLLILFLSVFLFGSAFFLNSYLLEKQKETKTEEVLVDENPISQGDEIRGVYIASVYNLNFPSAKGLGKEALQAELDGLVSECVSTGFNTIYFQVRPSADALYESSLFPSSRFLVSNESDPIPMDPLAYLIQKAAEFDIGVIAWINPYRITTASFDSKEEAIASLSDENIAKKNPDWTFLYGGKLYFDPGVSQVQNLIAEGVREVCSLYAIKGVLFDDYFYPYPITGEAIPDENTYKKSGSTLPLDDWRRENVNSMVEKSFKAVKSVSKELTFGVSPFGIWQNVSSDEKGSDTSGLEAYSALFCDALAWVRGGYVDYISPQLYWDRDHKAASFSVLVDWWNKQLKGTGVKLVISHGAYKSNEFAAGGEEIALQIDAAREYATVCGSIQYGYADIQKNNSGVRDALAEAFSDAVKEENL